MIKLTSIDELLYEKFDSSFTITLKDSHPYLASPQYLKDDINDLYGDDAIDDYENNGDNSITIKFGTKDSKIIKKVKDRLKKESLNEKVTKPIKLKDFENILDKYDYAHDVEEIAFALEDEEFGTCGDMKCIVRKLNSINMSLEQVDKILKDALEGY